MTAATPSAAAGPPAPALLSVAGLHKTFRGGRRALEDVGFHVRQGEIFGLLGPNGAGKSTTLGILLGMVAPDRGEVRIHGISVLAERERALRHVGAIFEAPAFYQELSGWRNLRVLTAYSDYWDRAEAERIVELVGLAGRIGDKVRTYSHGMRQRLALAQALLPRPDLLLLDEPTDGLDPEGIREFRELVRTLRDRHGITVLLNSHLLAEVERLCDRIAILKQGRLVYEGPLAAGSDGALLRVITDPAKGWEPLAAAAGFRLRSDGLLESAGPAEGADLVALLHGAGFRIREVAPVRDSLEEFYLRAGKEPAE